MELAIEGLKVDAGGEGSRGGKIIGHTSSGKPIYASARHPGNKNLTHGEHDQAKKILSTSIVKHTGALDKLQDKRKKSSPEYRDINKLHGEAVRNHAMHDRVMNEKEMKSELKKVQKQHPDKPEGAHNAIAESNIAKRHGVTFGKRLKNIEQNTRVSVRRASGEKGLG